MKKLLLSFLTALVLLFSFTPYLSVNAATSNPPAGNAATSATSNASVAPSTTSWYNQSPFEWYAKVYDDTNPNEIFGERYTAAQVQWVTYSFLFLPINIFYSILGMPPTPTMCVAQAMQGVINVGDCSSIISDFITAVAAKIKLPTVVASSTSESSLTDSSVVQTNDKYYIFKSIFLQDRSLSGISYVRNVAKKLSPVTEVKAANSFGFSKLVPIQDIWRVTRNIAYFFFVLVIVVAAFMVMFKVKISPQAVVSLQMALPKIVVAILLVTFSYAIAGFLVDLVYVVMGLFSQLISPLLPTGGANDVYQFLNGWGGDGFISFLIYGVLYWILSMAVSIWIVLVSLVNGSLASGVFGALLLIFFLINIIILVVYIFIGLFNLFKALAMFYLDVILGPIRLAVGAFPTSQGAFGGWLKGMIGKLAVFPATGILWFLGFYFILEAMSASFNCSSGVSNGMFAGAVTAVTALLSAAGAPSGAFASLISSAHSASWTCWAPPLLGNAGSATSIAFLLLSASCILLIAKVPKAIESALAGKPFDYEMAIGEPVKKAVSTAGTAVEVIGENTGGTVGRTLSTVGQFMSRMSH